MNKYSVVYAADSGYEKHLFVSIRSLLDTNRDVSVDIHVISSDLSQFFINKVSEAFEGNSVSIFFHNVANEFDQFITSHHFTKAMYYRLLIPRLISDDLVLYADADVIFCQKIDEIFEIDLQDNYIAAVINPGFDRHESLLMNKNSQYFNSGIMLINNILWKQDNISSAVKKYMEKSNQLIFPDQDALNAIVNGRWLILPPKYNQQTCFYNLSENQINMLFDSSQFDEALIDPVIVHFTGSTKPWHLCSKHPWKKVYWKYRNLTPYKTIFPDDFCFKKLLACYAPHALKKLIKRMYQ